jgi:hypothetical protein
MGLLRSKAGNRHAGVASKQLKCTTLVCTPERMPLLYLVARVHF